MELPRLAYRPREAAKVLGCSPQLIYDLLRDGRLRSVCVGRARLIPADSLTELLGATVPSTETDLESFLAIRRADGEPIGDYTWMAVTGETDWSVAEAETDGNAFDEPITWQIVRMVPELVAERTFPRSELA